VLVLLIVLTACLAVIGCAASSNRGSDTSVHKTAPTATPLPTDPLSVLVRQAVGQLALGSQAEYDASTGMVDVTATVGPNVPRTQSQISAVQAQVKTICFHVLEEVWTRPSQAQPLRTVTVRVVGPMFDDYADPIVSGYGGATLHAASASRLRWSALDPETAWSRYDTVWLETEFAPNQVYCALPACVPTATP
jgi:hypothetical protein